jgi:hypothetical protein
MPNLTPAQHAQLGCEYLDELLRSLQSHRWCFYDTYGIERKISEHAEALGIATPLDRPSKPEHETAEELQIWLKMHDPLTDSRRERLISRMVLAPPPAKKGTVLKTMCRPFDESEQAEFRQFVDRLKRELRRRGAASAPATQQPALPSWDELQQRTRDEHGRLQWPAKPLNGPLDHQQADGAYPFHPPMTLPDADAVAMFTKLVPGFDPDRPNWRAINDKLSAHDTRTNREWSGITLADLIASAQKAVQPKAEQASNGKAAMSKKAKALAALADNPEWTDEKIAAAAGCHVKSLYRWDEYTRARAILRDGRGVMPKGTKDKDTGDIEAWDERGDADDDDE